MEKEAKQSDKDSQPAESLLFGTGTSKHSRPSSSSEGRRAEDSGQVEAQGWVPSVAEDNGPGREAVGSLGSAEGAAARASVRGHPAPEGETN